MSGGTTAVEGAPRRTPRWGTDVVRETVCGHPQLVYRDRSRHVLEVLAFAANWPEAECIVQGSDRRTVGELLRAVEVAGERLRSLGVRPGDHVLLLSYNSPEWLVALWATWRVGAVPALGNRWWSEDELRHAFALVAPALVVTDLVIDLDVLGSTPAIHPADVRDLWGVLDLPATMPAPAADEDDPALIVFTSGSTGAAKAVVLSHRSVLANQHNLLARTGRLPGEERRPRQPVVLFTVPLFHIGGVSSVIVGLLSQARMVFLTGRFDPVEVLHVIERERVTIWGAVPTMVQRVLRHADFARRDLASLRTVSIGGAPVPEQLLQEVRERLPQTERTLTNTWGMTESGGHLTFASGEELVARPNTVGRAVPTVEIVIDGPSREGDGEILVRSPTVMLDLLPHEGDDTVDEAGYLHTGDVGRVDADGYLYITGRSKDIVIRGGENIACPNVERTILQHPDVIEVAVFGLPDPEFGEQVAAVVVISSGSNVTDAALNSWARSHLAHFEVPSRWILTRDELPILSTGKVDRVRLRAAVLGGACGSA